MSEINTPEVFVQISEQKETQTVERENDTAETHVDIRKEIQRLSIENDQVITELKNYSDAIGIEPDDKEVAEVLLQAQAELHALAQEASKLEEEPLPKQFDIHQLPLTPLQEKILRGENLTMAEKLKAGRDDVIVASEVPGIEVKPDHCYRSISPDTLSKYITEGGVETSAENDIYKPGENNEGVDWYLGGMAPKYGDIVIETPAMNNKFTLVEEGSNTPGSKEARMAKHPLVRFIKSEGGKNAVQLSEISGIYKKIRTPDGLRYEKISLENIT